MDVQTSVDGLVDPVQKPQEFLMPVPRLACSDYGSFEHVQCCEQRRRPVAFVIVRLPAGRDAMEGSAESGPEPESGSSPPHSERSLYPADSYRDPQCREPFAQTVDRY